MINIKGLEKSYGRKKVLRQIELGIGNSGVIAILGPNGSGKTTLIKSILGMVIPDVGTIAFNGADIHNKWTYRNSISYLPQLASFPENLKVLELIEMVRDIRSGETREAELINRFNLQPFLQSKMGALSGGTVQKVNIVLAFMINSPCIILDEPTSGLDPTALMELKKLIAEEKASGKTILVTSHIMQFVEEIADEIIYLLDGQVHFRGGIEDLMAHSRVDKFEEAIAIISRESE